MSPVPLVLQDRHGRTAPEQAPVRRKAQLPARALILSLKEGGRAAQPSSGPGLLLEVNCRAFYRAAMPAALDGKPEARLMGVRLPSSWTRKPLTVPSRPSRTYR